MSVPTTKALTVRSKIESLKDKAFLASCLLATFLSTAMSARAEGDIDDIFTAGAITGLSTNVKTLLLGFIGITIMFVGYKYFKRAANRG
jgi:hypothetical protein